MLHSFRYEDYATLSYGVLLIFQPQLNLTAQVVGVVRVGPEKAQDFIEIVRMGLCPALWGESPGLGGNCQTVST